jgi:hypothetical protein
MHALFSQLSAFASLSSNSSLASHRLFPKVRLNYKAESESIWNAPLQTWGLNSRGHTFDTRLLLKNYYFIEN